MSYSLGQRHITAHLADLLEPPDQRDPLEWIESNLYLSSGTARAGRIELSHIPYARGIIRDALSPDARQLTLMWPSRAGKTLAVACIWAYLAAVRGSPAVIIFPSVLQGARVIEQKLHPLIQDSPALRREVYNWRKVTTEEILLRRSKTWLLGAGNPGAIAAVSAELAYVDEVDKIAISEESSEAGDVVELSRQRTIEYADGTVIASSTPTTTDNTIAQEWLHSSRGRYWTQCPGCNGWHVWVAQIENENNELRDLGDAEVQIDWSYYTNTKIVDPDTIQITCSCGYGIREHQKYELLNAGEWRHPDADTRHRGYHLHRLQTNDARWEDIIAARRAAKRDMGKFRAFLNNDCARPWDRSKAKGTGGVETLKSYYRRIDDLADDHRYTLLGVDVQVDHFILAAVEITAGGTWRVLDARALDDADDVVQYWQTPGLGNKLADGIILDAGDGTRMREVLSLVQDRLGRGAHAYMGHHQVSARWSPSKRHAGTVIANARIYGEELYYRIHTGQVEWAAEIDARWLAQIANVKYEARGSVGGRTNKLVSHGDDHFFDAIKMAGCLLDVYSDNRVRGAEPGSASNIESRSESKPQPPRRKRRRRRGTIREDI